MVATSVPTMLREAVRRHRDRPAQRVERGGSWFETSYEQLGRSVDGLTAALIASGVSPGDRVAIYARNCPEWTQVDLAVLSAGAVTVSVYTTSPPSQISHVLNDSGARMLFVGSRSDLATVSEVWADCPALQEVVVMSGAWGDAHPQCVGLQEFVARASGDPGTAAEADRRIAALTSSSLATLIYSPGTTGVSKGVMLTHGNILSQVAAIDRLFTLEPGDRSVCFLPLAHAYERVWSFMVVHFGIEHTYVADPHDIVRILHLVRPHAFVSTPRLYHKIHDRVRARAEASSVGAKGYDWAVQVGCEFHRRLDAGERVPVPLRTRHLVAERMVLAAVRDAVGGPKRVLSCGGSVLNPATSELFFAAGVPIYHGYGQIETTAMTTCNRPGGHTFDTVGRAVPGCQVRIAANGEILVRGSNVMAGDYNRPEETAAVMDGDWFHTGDMGQFTRTGELVVTDRLADVIVTAHGTVVAPLPLESALTAHPFVERAIVLGEGRQFLTALIQPSFGPLEEYARRRGLAFASRRELLDHPRVRNVYAGLVAQAGAGLEQQARLQDFRLLDEELTQRRGDLSATEGIRRAVVEFRFEEAISSMYAASA